MKTTIAALADIHGNTPALAAVLYDMREAGIERAYNLGDTLYGPLDPAGTYWALRTCGIEMVHILGNGDRILLEAGEDASPTVRHTLAHLEREHLDWLKSLPAIHEDNFIFACHGSPKNDMEYLVEHLEPGGVTLRADTELVRLLEGVRQSLVLCGHSHLHHAVRVSHGPLVVNPGSVGLPAYADNDPPVPHVMESGSPHARYAVLDVHLGHWEVQFRCVPYDHESAAAMAAENGRPDWAEAIRSGRAGL